MRTLIRTLVMISTLALAACGSTGSVRPLDPMSLAPSSDWAIVVLSLSVAPDYVAAPGSPPVFAVDFDRYDLDKQTVVGGCLRPRDLIQAQLPAQAGAHRTFAFSVPPGAYVPSPFMAASLSTSVADIAQAGKIVYLGHFQLSGSADSVTEAAGDLNALIEQLGQPIEPAPVIGVTPPQPWLCAP